MTKRASPDILPTAARLLRRYGYHVLFALSILSLAALATWWSVFIRASVAREHKFHYDSMMTSAKAYAVMLGYDAANPPKAGVLERDNRLEVVKCDKTDQRVAQSLRPHWAELCLAPRYEFMQQIEKEFRSKTIMVTGESTVLLLVILISSLMLYRMTWMERRTSKELQEFWSRLTHEIKTPITGIKAFLQTVQAQPMSHEEMQPLLTLALREVERQEMLTENILVGQRMEKEGFGLQIKTLNLAQQVRDFLEEHRIILTGKTVSMSVSCPEDTPVQADPDALRVILENLTDNALKYGGVKLELKFEVSADGKTGVVTVSDNGVGFEPSSAEAMFDAYRRLTEELPEGRHGTGMGLYISRQLARKMGGDLRASSEGRGRGARFVITLKRTKQQ